VISGWRSMIPKKLRSGIWRTVDGSTAIAEAGYGIDCSDATIPIGSPGPSSRTRTFRSCADFSTFTLPNTTKDSSVVRSPSVKTISPFLKTRIRQCGSRIPRSAGLRHENTGIASK